MTTMQYNKLNRKVSILFFTTSLGGGGAEKNLLRILNHLDREKFNISVALARGGGSYESALAEDVKLNILNTGKISSTTLRMIRSIIPLRRLIKTEKPDIVFSVLDIANIVAVVACSNLTIRPKLVLNVQNTPSVQYKQSGNIVKRIILSLIPSLYPEADRIVALSQGVAEDLKTLTGKITERTEVIYNAGLDERLLQGISEPLVEELPHNNSLIVACGRLTEQKGFPFLIEALAYVRQVIPAHLWIIGEGKQRQELEEQIEELNLRDCVKLLGFQNNPYKYMASADVFVLSSIFEGFGNVIVEAMACGAPVVATDCPSGPGEIIENEVNGLLVPTRNVKALSEAIIRVLTNKELKQQLSQKGKERSQDFHAQNIASAYGKMFLNTVNKSIS